MSWRPAASYTIAITERALREDVRAAGTAASGVVHAVDANVAVAAAAIGDALADATPAESNPARDAEAAISSAAGSKMTEAFVDRHAAEAAIGRCSGSL